MAAKYWLKLYYEMLDDPKIGQLRPALRWRFVECLLVAGECADDGALPAPAEYAWRVRGNTEEVETDFVQLSEAGLLSQVDGRWIVTKFAERQAPVSGAERVARYRERKRKQEYYGDETPELPNGNEGVTIRYTDTDKIRSDKIQKATPLPSYLASPDMLNEWGEWNQYHIERNGKPIPKSTALLQFEDFKRWGEQRSIAAMQYSIRNNYAGLFEPKGKKIETNPHLAQIKSHIQKYGSRKVPQFNGTTEQIVRLAGGYRALCTMSEEESDNALKLAAKEINK